jgi:hypothetical protein
MCFISVGKVLILDGMHRYEVVGNFQMLAGTPLALLTPYPTNRTQIDLGVRILRPGVNSRIKPLVPAEISISQKIMNSFSTSPSQSLSGAAVGLCFVMPYQSQTKGKRTGSQEHGMKCGKSLNSGSEPW